MAAPIIETATEYMCGGCAMYHKVLLKYGYRDEVPHFICRSCAKALIRAFDKIDEERKDDKESDILKAWAGN